MPDSIHQPHVYPASAPAPPLISTSTSAASDSDGTTGASSSKKRVKTAAAAANSKQPPGKRKKSQHNPADEDSDPDEEEIGSRFRWTDELHQYFLSCIFEIGLETASPKKVFNKMCGNPDFARTLLDADMMDRMFECTKNVTTTTTLASAGNSRAFLPSHVKSHLQRFRTNVPHPKQAFVEQVVALMQEAKDRHSSNKQNNVVSKVLNPQFHAYPFAADRKFPEGLNAPVYTAPPPPPPAAAAGAAASTVPSALIPTPLLQPTSFLGFNGELQLLDPSMLLSSSLPGAGMMAPQLPSSAASAAAVSAASAAMAGNIPDIAQKMQIQTELRQQIELRFQGSVVPGNASMGGASDAHFQPLPPPAHQQQQQQHWQNSSTAFLINNSQSYGLFSANHLTASGANDTSVEGNLEEEDKLFDWLDAADEDFFENGMQEL